MGWSGTEWQDYCILLLQKRYAAQNAHSLQIVPDRDRGDLGMEAYSLDGCAFQCYAAQDPLSTKQRYEKQRDKLTEDLGKLRKYQDQVAALLGSVKIHRYVFMVHLHDSKDLITHGHNAARKVLTWGLPFIDPAFDVIIETEADYAAERKAIHAIPTPLVQTEQVNSGEQDAWAQANTNLQDTARGKLAVVVPSASARDLMVEKLTLKYLEGENALDRLRTIQPQTHSRLLAMKADKEDLLVLEYAGATATHQQGLLAVIADQFSEYLLGHELGITREVAETLAWAAVADWLMRCPLDFEATA